MNPLCKTVLFPTLAVVLAASAPAQWLAASGWLDRSQGNSNASSFHDVYGVMVSSPQHAYAGTDIDNDARLFGSQKDGGTIESEAYTNTRTGTSRAGLTASAGGNQLVSSSHSSLLSHNKVFFVDIFPVDPQITVMIGFMPVTLSANAGVLVRASVSLTANLAANSVGITGYAYAALYGAARVLIGLSFAGAGVEARLELGRAQVDTGLIARTGFIGGTATATLTAVALRIVAFINLFVRLGEVTLIDITGPQLSRSGFIRP